MAEGIQVTVQGLSELMAKSAHAQEVIMKSLAKGVYREGELVMSRSKDEFVPVDLGALKSTGHVEEPVITGTTVTVEMGYGGPSGVATADGKDYVGYALYVHEDEGAHHEVGSSGYLEKPAMEESSHMPDRVKSVIAQDLEKL